MHNWNEGEKRGGIFAIWVKTLTNLFLHQWVRTAWCKNKFSLYLIPSSIVKHIHAFLPHFSLSPSKRALSQSKPSPSFIHSHLFHGVAAEATRINDLNPLLLLLCFDSSFLWNIHMHKRFVSHSFSHELLSPLGQAATLFFITFWVSI